MVGLICLFLLGMVFCLGSGILVGVFTERVDLGVAVTSGVAAVVGCVEAFLFLVYNVG